MCVVVIQEKCDHGGERTGHTKPGQGANSTLSHDVRVLVSFCMVFPLALCEFQQKVLFLASLLVKCVPHLQEKLLPSTVNRIPGDQVS